MFTRVIGFPSSAMDEVSVKEENKIFFLNNLAPFVDETISFGSKEELHVYLKSKNLFDRNLWFGEDVDNFF